MAASVFGAWTPAPSQAVEFFKGLPSMLQGLGRGEKLALGAVSYLSVVALLRYRRRNSNRRKYRKAKAEGPVPDDVLRDVAMHMSAFEYEWPFLANDSGNALHAYMRTFVIPSISRLLVSTGEAGPGQARAAKRAEDTGIFIAHIMQYGHHTPDGQRALTRVNALHGRYPISNEDFVYVLTCFMCEPPQAVDHWGYRETEDFEKDAIYQHWKRIGTAMGIKDNPASWDDALQFQRDYDAKHAVFHKANAILANTTLDVVLAQWPAWTHFLVRPYVVAQLYMQLGRRLTGEVLGLPRPSGVAMVLTDMVLKAHGLAVRFLLPPRVFPVMPTSTQSVLPGGRYRRNMHPLGKIYPDGYLIEELGPVKLKDELKGVGAVGCPFRPQPSAGKA